MRDTLNPAAVPGILPDIDRHHDDDLPPEADPHFGHEDAEEADDRPTGGRSPQPDERG